MTGNTVNYGNSWSTIGNGGAPECALEEITGASVITDFSAYAGSWTTITYNSSSLRRAFRPEALRRRSSTRWSPTSPTATTWCCRPTRTRWTAPGRRRWLPIMRCRFTATTAPPAYARGPQPLGHGSGQTWDTTFEVSLSTLLSDGDTITADNIGTGIGPVSPRQSLLRRRRLRPGRSDKPSSFTLASNTFTDPQGEKLTYRATLSNGAALPSWLTFNAATDTFTGTVPTTAAGLSIKVTATDAGGASASETFAVLTPAAAPTLTAQTAPQNWTDGRAIKLVLPANTFTDPQGEKLTYSATLATGSALPSWLTFNAATDTFTGTAPMTASKLSISVKATDTSGLSASETFSATIASAAKSPNPVSALLPPARLDADAVNIALLGQYLAASFATASPGQGGTMITDHAPDAVQHFLAQPHV